MSIASKMLLPMLAALAVAGPAPAQPAPPLTGTWDAVATANGASFPFQLRLSQDRGGAHAVFFDGDRPINPSTGGSFKDGRLHLDFASYATQLDASLDQGVLRGTYFSSRASYAIEARPHRAVAASPVKAPPIAGLWEIPVASSKGEKAWRLIITQKGARAYASILRIDGDTGTLSGDYRDGRYQLSRFAGERPGWLEITPQSDGTLKLLYADTGSRRVLQAQRPHEARKGGLAAPADPKRFTSVKDANETFRFSAPDLNGKPVTEADPRFKGKVVLVNITGSWCPNCHDEAPFLAALYDKYKGRGLEIVGLDFEQPDQLQDPTRLRAFIKKYGLHYTVLLAGDTKDVLKEVPQAVNLNAWPTTFFLGRDGKVKSVHVGFTSLGSGPYDTRLKADVAREIEGLLAERG